MISICIPVYNCDVTVLADSLHQQGEHLHIPFEIILIDDASSKEFQEFNKKISLKYLRYIPLDKNIGRAKIRNRFLEYAQYDYLLFLDCDSAIIDDRFLLKYIDLISQKDIPIAFGGRIYDKKRPERNRLLRWRYGIKKESRPASIRRMSPNKSFMSNNFVIKKEMLRGHPFDETISGYGHEDTLFGFRLKEHAVGIVHLDNPIRNDDIEDNALFLKKTEEGIQNLLYILALTNYHPDLIKDIALAKIYEKLQTKGLVKILNLTFSFIKPSFRFLLKKGYFSLWMFHVYKLGIFIENADKNKNNFLMK